MKRKTTRQSSLPKIGVLHGLIPRLTQAEFATQFKNLKPVLITGEANQKIVSFCRQQKLELRDLPLKPLFGLDPVKWILGRTSHQAWLLVESLEEACRDLDVVITDELYNFYSGRAAEISKKLEIPLISNVWETLPNHLGYFLPPYSGAVKKVIKQADLFITRSRRAKQALIYRGIPSQKIKVIHYGVNLHRFFPARGKKKPKKIQVLFVGGRETLAPEKGVDQLLGIWPRVLKVFPRAELVIVGTGPLYQKAKKAKGVRALGWVSHLKLPEIYRQADLFVAPSRDRYLGPFLRVEESFSYVLMEAQASGLPIIATDCGANAEAIGKKNWLVPQKNPELLLKAILKALGDEKKRGLIGVTNWHRAQRLFDLQKQVRKLETEILKLLKREGK